MKYDEKRQYVQAERKRARDSGCRSCKKRVEWLILEGGPSLFDLLRSGASKEVLDEAMVKRGWYCRACIAKRAGKAKITHLEITAKVVKAKLIRNSCLTFLEGIAGNRAYDPFRVSLLEEECVSRLMGLIQDGQAKDAEEAYFLLGALLENELVMSEEG